MNAGSFYIPKRRPFGKTALLMLAAACLCSLLPGRASGDAASGAASETAATASGNAVGAAAPHTASYEAYLSDVGKYEDGQERLTISAADASAVSGAKVVDGSAYGAQGKVLYTDEEGWAEWNITVDQPGLYSISADYYAISGRSAAVERSVSIDGQTPFAEAESTLLPRMWQNSTADLLSSGKTPAFKTNRAGNEIVPDQVEYLGFRTQTFEDSDGYYNSPFVFYFSKGTHVLRLTSVREPCVLRTLWVEEPEKPVSYAQYRKTVASEQQYTGQAIRVQGEDAAIKSDTMLYPGTDHSSPDTQPQDAMKIKLNTIGGSSWSVPRQWIEWNITVPADGLYKISMRVRQNIKSGISSSRALYIDGKLPFAGCEAVSVQYGGNWQTVDVGDGGNPYLFYLTKGTHTLTLEAVIGRSADDYRKVQEAVQTLNTAYRRILMLTGRSPDIYRDYHLEKSMPDLFTTFTQQAGELRAISGDLITLSGRRGSMNATLDNLALQLESFVKNPLTITARLDEFSSNITALGSWTLDAASQPLEVDYIDVMAPDAKDQKDSTGPFGSLLFQTQSFIGSFLQDYASMGADTSVNGTLDVWVQTGRDQAAVLNSLVQKGFSGKNGVGVNIKLVTSNAMLTNMSQLLSATVAGKGPDIALMLNNAEAQNYASRNALCRLSDFADFKDVARRFNTNAMIPFAYNGGYYALPETQSCLMTFWRTDIFSDLSLTVPKTWREVYDCIGALQKNNLEFGIPGGSSDADLSFYGTLLAQYGGQLYTQDGKKSALDTKTALGCFKMWTELYTSYGVPIDYDALNRFRTGEMPIVITDLSFYNSLSVFAPELRGDWSFTAIPGVAAADGSIDNVSVSTGLCCFILRQSKKTDLAWNFLKWWTSADALTGYGRGFESIQGAAARYPSANMEAVKALPWKAKDMQLILAQLEKARPNPEVPGGYYTGRYIENALRDVLTQNANPRATLLDYVTTINDEIRYKRQEFGLPT